ncbi:MAG: glycoside hydrolase family 127 protein [Prevotella sp.]
MHTRNLIVAGMALLASIPALSKKQEKIDKVVSQVNFSQVKVKDAFWTPRLDRLFTGTLPVCIDQIENQTGRMQNFINASKGEGKHSGIFFDDSDVYKALEGIAYSLINHPDAALEAKADEWIDYMAGAQQPDGYLYTFHTLGDINQRWTNMDQHEMYCAGHLLEAAVAYKAATGKDKLLKVGIRMVEHMMKTFGDGSGQRHWVPGHEEIELALVKLADATGERKYLDFAYWLLCQRGHGYGKWPSCFNETHYQDTCPVEELRSIGGHAVRAMYLFCGMVDVAARRPGTPYREALDALWEDVVERNMYITGGIGSSASNEGFTQDYDLPNASAYCETCASIGMALWNMRMNEWTGESRYIDVMERSIYNGMLAGVSLQGDRFFYVNPLSSEGTHHRQAWYGCACCPSNVARFLPSIGGYVYGTSDDALWVNLFIGGEATMQVGGKRVQVEMATGYPWNGDVNLKMLTAMKKDLRVRIPGWCRHFQLMVNGQAAAYTMDRGYAVISRNWKKGDTMCLKLSMPVNMVEAHPLVRENAGKRAIQRGPLVYCMEQVDNAEDLTHYQLTGSTQFETRHLDGLLDGVTVIDARSATQQMRLVPYYAWDNRQAGKMRVWLPFSND